MATINQRNRSGGQKGRAGGHSSGKSDLQEAAYQASGKLSEMGDDVRVYISQGAEQFGRLTRGHESQAVLVALVAGVSVGFVIGCALVSGNRRPKTWSDRLMSEGFGKKLIDRVERMIPDAVAEHFGR